VYEAHGLVEPPPPPIVVELSVLVGLRLMSPDSQPASTAAALMQTKSRFVVIMYLQLLP
jgi:hypothetical protein